MSIATSAEFSNKRVPNVIPFPTDPNFKGGKFLEEKISAESKTDLLFEAYISERKRTSNRQKPIYFNTKKYSNFPESPSNSFNVVFEKTTGFETLKNLPEKTLDEFLLELGDKTSRSVGGLVYKTTKIGFNVGIAFKNKNNYFSRRGDGNLSGGDSSGSGKNAEDEKRNYY